MATLFLSKSSGVEHSYGVAAVSKCRIQVASLRLTYTFLFILKVWKSIQFEIFLIIPGKTYSYVYMLS